MNDNQNITTVYLLVFGTVILSTFLIMLQVNGEVRKLREAVDHLSSAVHRMQNDR